ncbi:MAG TPA: glycosyl hydrolase [Kiritimatiellia bacterium]|nr:glycosyl hydrolase [Kiritimatiellia bacterium]
MQTSLRPIALLSVLAAVAGRSAEAPLTALPPQPAEERPLAERFAEPPASTRILRIIHGQKNKPEEQDKHLLTLAEQGFGGFAGNVSFDGYVEDETKWPPFLRGVQMAKASGMSLWLYDERGYPSGSAGDLTLRGHPEWAARGLLIAETNVTGGAAVSLSLPPGRLVAAVAVPRCDGVIALDRAVDLAASVVVGHLSWQAPDGEWFVAVMTDDLIYEGTHAAISLAYKKPCIDLLTPEPTARFLEVTHDRYAAQMGKDLGRYFVSTFTDEPSLQNLWFRPMPYRVLPWSLTIEREFRKRRGRALRPLLPALVADAGPAGARARYDFWNTVGELVSENFFGQIQTWCARHNILSGGHLLAEESLVSHVPLYGDFFRCARRLDAPSIDCLTSLPPGVPWHIARLIGSVADLEGRTYTMCEVSDHSQRYRPKGDTRPIRVVTEDEIRGTCNRLVWGGINTLTSYYAFKDLSDDQLRRINTHVGRCQTLLRGGHHVADIAVLYPIESVWSAFTPAYRGATDEAGARRVESVFDGVSAALYSANRDFGYVDARALCDATVDGDALRHGDLRWRVLVLPAADTLPMAAWRKVHRFWQSGGTVIAVGALPANSETDAPSPAVQVIAREMFGATTPPNVVTNRAGGAGIALPFGMLALTPKMIDAVLERDAACDDARAPIKITRRRIDGHDLYFAINDSDAAWDGTVRFCGDGVREQWDPATGARSAVADATRVPLRLGPYGAMFFRAPQAGIPRRLAQAGSVTLAMTCKPLPDAGRPTIGKGTHVRAELAGDAAGGWRAPATLTRGQVDTHLFVSFPYTQPLDLSGYEGLVLDTAVPAGQRTAAELLVFIQTADGGTYLGRTGRFLNVAGAARAYALFGQFAAFGNTQKALDLTQVTAIRIGWGGYFGSEGETVDLTVHPPQALSGADQQSRL